MTTERKAAILQAVRNAGRGATAQEVALKLWPKSPSWKAGWAYGLGARMAAGRVLAMMVEEGMVFRTPHDYQSGKRKRRQFVFALTMAGLTFLAQVGLQGMEVQADEAR